MTLDSDDCTVKVKRPEPAETTRLIAAFRCITDEQMRATVLALAQKYASKSPEFVRAMRKLLMKVKTGH
jgi:hypothetical protein